MNLEQLLARIVDIHSAHGWIVQEFVLLFLILLFNLALKLLLDRLHGRLTRTRNPWDDALVDSLRKPLYVLIWVLGVTFAAEIAGKHTEAAIFDVVGPVREIGVIFTLTWFLIRLIKGVEKNIIARAVEAGREVDRTTADAVAKLLRISVLITASLVALQTLGYSISGVLAFGGIGGIAVGFAAKDLLSNFFGGLMIFLDRPFAVGDWVRSPDRNIEGTVEEIGWRLTRIRTFDKRPLYIPNSVFTTIAVENPSRMTHRRIYETIGVRYDDIDKVPVILADIRSMLVNHEEIDASQTLMVNFNEFAASSLDFFVYTFTRTTNWIKFHQVKEDVLLRINEIIAGHGAEIAFPTSTVHVPEPILLGEPPEMIAEQSGA